jgi:uncharacterized protein YjiK
MLSTACQSTSNQAPGAAAPAETTACRCNPADILFPYQKVVEFREVEFYEPSGITFHPDRNSFFVVGDQGYLTEIGSDGRLIKQQHIDQKADFEAISLHPATGLLYLVDEGRNRLLEIDPETLAVQGSINLDFSFEDGMLIDAEGKGIEGMAFVPDDSRAEGGSFYLANQSEALSGEDPSIIMEMVVNDATQPPIAHIARYFSIGVTDLADMAYDAGSRELVVISDTNNLLLRVNLAGEIQSAYALPGQDQEAVTLDAQGALYIGEDSGYVIKYVLTGE